jgi:hypothetical protein
VVVKGPKSKSSAAWISGTRTSLASSLSTAVQEPPRASVDGFCLLQPPAPVL